MAVYREAEHKRADYRRVSKAIIRRRISTINAIRASLGWVATKLAPWKVRSFWRKNLKYSHVFPATISQAWAMATVTYSNAHTAWNNSAAATSGRPSPEADVAKKAAMGSAAIRVALPVVTQRMKAAVEKMLARRCAEASAVGRSIARAV